eukprot:TRINITY_DN16578_c0_g1_i1.p1 TRINITY_DN16578_c0_g1~~TRINITY_DN16578_c0_g1_i1.p1  ORF type:complete len:354 (+),score=30.67 TRINITY_DN16578_c0_g1_i1:58-1119(+)
MDLVVCDLLHLFLVGLVISLWLYMMNVSWMNVQTNTALSFGAITVSAPRKYCTVISSRGDSGKRRLSHMGIFVTLGACLFSWQACDKGEAMQFWNRRAQYYESGSESFGFSLGQMWEPNVKITVGCEMPEQIISRGGRGSVGHDRQYAQGEKGSQDFESFEPHPCPACVGRFLQGVQDVCGDAKQSLVALCIFVGQRHAPDWIGDCLIDASGQPTHGVAVHEDVDVVVAPRDMVDAVDSKYGHRSATPEMWELFGMYGRILEMEAADTCEGPVENIQSALAKSETTDVEASRKCTYLDEDSCWRKFDTGMQITQGCCRIFRVIIRRGRVESKPLKNHLIHFGIHCMRSLDLHL